VTPPRLLLRTWLVVASLFGLLAMHGLSADHAMPMTAMPMTAMPAGSSHAMDTAEAAPSSAMQERAGDSSCAAERSAMTAHSQCVATLTPGIPQLGAPVCTDQSSSEQALALAAGSAGPGRGPPEISLTRLCISRT
jgi:hypothetical protein